MFPPEIFTLVVLASLTSAYPQQPVVFNTTLSSSLTTATDADIDGPPTVINTGTPWIIIESTATGWETDDSPPITTPPIRPPDQRPQIITTQTQIWISIHTEISPQGPNPPNDDPRNGGPGGGTSHTWGGDDGPAPTGQGPAVPQHSPDGDLLTEIVSKIGNPQPNSRPASPADANPRPQNNDQSVPNDENTEQHQNTTPGWDATPGITAAPQVQPTIAVGSPITVGPATLTLTPGLSTTVGSGSAATFVGLTTNTAGQTIIVVSSSGTAVTATITNAPVTMTMPRTGFEASVTAEARPGQDSNPSADGVVSTTSSKGGAVTRRAEIGSWLSLLLGIVGMGVAL